MCTKFQRLNNSNSITTAQPPVNLDRLNSMSSNFPSFHSGDNASAGMIPAAAASNTTARNVESDKNERTKPKRPLSAYNFFFHHERQKILSKTPTRKEGKPRRSHGKIGFADLARSIAAKWKSISQEDRAPFDEQAAADKLRYQNEMEVWKKEQAESASKVAREGEVMTQQGGAADYSSIFQESEYQPHFMRQQTNFVVDPFDINIPVESSTFQQDDARLHSDDDNSFEPYSFTDAFSGSAASTSKTQAFTQQQGQYVDEQQHQKPFAQPSVASDNQYYSQQQQQQDTSPKIADLASQLDDESTQLFLSIFGPSRQHGM